MDSHENDNEFSSISGNQDAKENCTSVKIKVLFFARARDITGKAAISLEVPPGTTAHGCLNELINEFPGLEEIRNCMLVALNEEYSTESTVVKDR